MFVPGRDFNRSKNERNCHLESLQFSSCPAFNHWFNRLVNHLFVRTLSPFLSFFSALNVIVLATLSELLKQATDVSADEIGHNTSNRANETQVSSSFRPLPAASNDTVRNNLY